MSADFSDLFAGVKDALGDVLGGARPRRQTTDQPSYYEQYFSQLGGGPFGAATPDVTYGAAPGQGAPNFGIALGPGPFGASGATDPFGERFGVALGGDPLGGAFGQRQQGAMDQALFAKKAREDARTAASARSGTATEAGDWSGPATADDNATLDGGKIDAFIRGKNPNSPLLGRGQYILDTANKYGVSAPELLSIFWKESSFATTAGPGWNIAGVGGEGNFRQYGSLDQAIDGAAANLGSGLYRGKSAQDHIGYWFVGTDYQNRGGLDATDSTGGRNGTVRDYLNNFVGPTYAGLGVPFNQGAGGTRKAGGGATGGLMGVTGGRGSIMQEFGSTDYAEANPDVYSFATSMGLRAGQHSGIDLGVPRGTQLFSPVAGTVVIAGNSGFYKDAGGGPGELRIRLDNGDELILGHDSAINVRVGQRVTPGMLVGLSGGSDGDHVHVEYRIRDSSTPSGWRIVDPRTKLGAGTAYTAPIARGRPS